MPKMRAIYGNGMFRPEGHVDLPEGTAVEIEFQPVPVALPPLDPGKKLLAINAIMAEQQKLQRSHQPILRQFEGDVS